MYAILKYSMKIAFLNIYGGMVFRGAERSVDELARRLSKRGHDVTVFRAAPQSNELYHVKAISNIPIVSTDVSNNLLYRFLKKFYLDPYSLLVLYFSLRSLPKLWSERFDVLLPINGFWQILVCKIVQFFRGGKIGIFGYAGIGSDDYLSLKISPDIFFPMTHTASLWAKKVNPKVPLKVVPGGVDTKSINPDVKPMKISLKKPIILTIAALVPYKRVDLVIQAVAKLPAASLLLVGNGPLKEEIEELGKQLLGNRFQRIDASFTDLSSIYTAASLFTLPSIHQGKSLFKSLTGQETSEAFGIVYVEAMAANIPIVAPDDELRREIVGPAGIFVDCTDGEAYAEAMKKALNKNWDGVPRKQAMEFEWDQITTILEKALLELT